MEAQNEHSPEPNSAKAEAHIASAQQILKALQEKIGGTSRNRSGHPEAGDGTQCPRHPDRRTSVVTLRRAQFEAWASKNPHFTRVTCYTSCRGDTVVLLIQVL